jgi:hypothetical protein
VNTIFPVFVDAPHGGEPWTPALAFIPFVDDEAEVALTNIALFLPFGVMIPLLLAQPSCQMVRINTVGVSHATEIAQLAAQRFAGGGHIAGVDDFIFRCPAARLDTVPGRAFHAALVQADDRAMHGFEGPDDMGKSLPL